MSEQIRFSSEQMTKEQARNLLDWLITQVSIKERSVYANEREKARQLREQMEELYAWIRTAEEPISLEEFKRKFEELTGIKLTTYVQEVDPSLRRVSGIFQFLKALLWAFLAGFNTASEENRNPTDVWVHGSIDTSDNGRKSRKRRPRFSFRKKR